MQLRHTAMMDAWMWVAAGLGLAMLEVMTPGSFVFVFMALAACMVGALAGLGVLPAFWQQSAAAALLSGLNLVLFRRRLLGLFTPRRAAPPVDALVGSECTVTEAMAPQALGRAELHGSSWQARNVDAGPLAHGARCRVVGCDGLTLRLVAVAGSA